MRKIYLALLLLTTGMLMTGKTYAQPSITYSPISASCVSGNVVVNGVTISDATGVPTAGGSVPRLYVKKNSGSWVSAPGTLASGTGTSGTWDFTVTSAALGGLFASNNVSYFIVAENTASAISAVPSAGFSATSVNTISTFPTSPNVYTVLPQPSLGGLTATPNNICVGLPFTLNSGVASGTGGIVSYNWSGPDGFSTTSSTPSVALTPTTTAATGLYSLNVTYPGQGCTTNTRSVSVTVNGAMPAITGGPTVCVGSTSNYSIATTGGGWFSSNPSVATISSTTGVATGVAAGTTTISYVKGNCYVTTVLSVDPLPAPIAGPSAVCVGSSMTLTNATAGGNWTSSVPAVASVTALGGVVSGLTNGTTVITYTLPTTCRRTYPVTVNVVPTAISGTMVVCEGASTNFSSTPSGGTWSSSNTSVANVGLLSGAVAGVAQGTATISYLIGGASGCVATAVVTVNPLPAPITGPSSTCVGFTNTLSSLTAGGVWSSGNPVVATVSPSGVVAGVIAGTTTISYTLPTGCARTQSVVVNTTPTSIPAPHSVCVGSNITFSSLPTGTWSSSNVGVASVVSPAGTVTGVSVGTAIISNILSTGCYRTAVVTVNPVPPAITGVPTVCTGASTLLSNAAAGGVWSTPSAGVVTVDPVTGLVTGISAGVVSVNYSFGTGCSATLVVTTNTTPSIGGATSVCEGSVTILNSYSSPGGTWSSSNTAIATIGSSTGMVNSLVAGTTTISYLSAAGCAATRVLTVNVNPGVISGSLALCVNTTTSLSIPTVGGVWTSSSPAIASVNGITGVVTGVAGGTATITYKLASGCYSTAMVTVNALPSAITGNAAVCLGATTSLSSLTLGGGWSTSNAAVASVTPTGVVTGNAIGTAYIYYTSVAGCVTSRIVTVNAVPGPIGGSLNACAGAVTTYTNPFLSGIWTSSDPLVATITPSGSLAGISIGTTNITYTLPNTCAVSATVTVNASPLPISGTTNTCVGGTSLLSNATPGGTWNSSNVSVGSVDGVTGVVSGITAGTTTISYTLGNGCKSSAVFSVNVLPTAISGTLEICQGQTSVLLSTPTGGTWSTSDPFVAVTTTGVVTGMGAGVATVTYSLGTGCMRTVSMTVNPLPAAITGANTTCIGSTTTLTNATPSGTWTSSNSMIATVDPITGVATGITNGSVTMTYTLTTGCKAVRAFTVNTLPAVVGGVASTCQGYSTTLTNSTFGGTWLSSNTGVAIVGTGSGVVVGIAPGTSEISYVLPATGCVRTKVVTVNPIPTAITGTLLACVGNTTTLSSATLGGTWTSSNTSVATIGNTTGIVTGVAAGVTNITYKMGTGCFVTAQVTVNLLPSALAGVSSVCIGANTVFTSSTPGGTWSSSDVAVATVGTGGVIAGVSNGVAFITYTMPTGCYVTKSVTVNGAPSPIAGTLSLCQGATAILSSLTPGGTWSSLNPGNATIGLTSGILTAVFPGTATIAYTAPWGCTSTAVVTVNPIPNAISGVTNICLGSSSSLSSLTPGGTWSISNPVVASVGVGTGIVNGLTVGTATVTYSLATGCRTTATISVTNIPAAILGVPNVCVGSTTSLSNATSGGTWSSTDLSLANVSSSGVVSGVGQGVVVISYTMPTGCASTKIVTVEPVPSPIVEIAAVCVGDSMALTSATPGGIWTSSVPSRAIINVTTGMLTGLSSGTSMITYSLPSGCRAYTVATVSAVPTAIVGVMSICSGNTTTLANGVPGGIWSSDDNTVATVDAGTGVVTGTAMTYNTTTIRYSVAGGCQATAIVTVTAAPPAITGNTTICASSTSLLSNSSIGGTWSCSNPSVATVDLASGLVTGVAPGTATVTYTLGIGCKVTTNIVVNPAPSPITGPSEVCMGQSITLANAVGGGSWSSNNISVASVDISTGVVTGIANDVVQIDYTLPGGCMTSFTVTVHSTPPLIGGADSICMGSTTVLTNGSPFSGIWTSSNPAVAPIGLTSGIVSGVTVGTSNITYTILGTGCYRSTTVTVNPVPGPLTGSMNVCEGGFTVLTPTSPGGIWTSSNTTIAMVGSTTGIVNGMTAGGATISYTLPTGCVATGFVVVNPLPSSITGTAEICMGSSTIFTNPTPFGTWSSNNTSIATVGSTSGEVTAVSPGIVTISYTLLATGCYITKQVTVNPVPPSISGTPFMCEGGSTFLSNPLTGGTWSSSNPLVATIDGFGNVVSAGTGTTTITYTLTSACYITQLVTVEPTLNPIVGGTNVCEGSTTPFTNTYIGGIWSSSNIGVATVGTSGVVTGVSAGSATITYETPLAGCDVTKTIVVDPLPTAISGVDSVCVASTQVYTTLTSGGTWSTTDVTLATIATDGTLTGVSSGVVTVSYTIGTGCASTLDVRVKALANSGDITGAAELCLNDSTVITTTGSEGTWSSSDTMIAKINAEGKVFGLAAGTVVLSYISINDCSRDTSVFNMLVKPSPDAGDLSGNASLCINYSSTLSSTVSGGVWTSSNPAIASINASGVVTGLVAGTTTISYAVTTSCGTDIATRVVTVNVMAPHTNITVHPASVICANAQYQNFGAEQAPPAGLNYAWSATNASVYATSPDKQNAVINFDSVGTAIVRLTTQITATGCFVTDSFVVTVNSTPAYTPEVKYFAEELICTDNTSTSYQWGYDDAVTLDSNIIPGAIQQSYYLPDPQFTTRNYWVIAGRDGCFQKVYYNKPTGVDPVAVGTVDAKLFPNPATATLNIEVRGITSADVVSVRLVDMLGREIETFLLRSGKGNLNVSDLSAGVYTVMFINNGVKVASRTFVKN